jgi:hypothetical protein
VSAKDFLSIFRVWLISEHHQIDQRCTLKILQLINFGINPHVNKDQIFLADLSCCIGEMPSYFRGWSSW